MLLSAVKLQSGVFVFFFAAAVPAVLLFTANKRQSGSVPSRQAPRRGKKPGFSAGVFFQQERGASVLSATSAVCSRH